MISTILNWYRIVILYPANYYFQIPLKTVSAVIKSKEILFHQPLKFFLLLFCFLFFFYISAKGCPFDNLTAQIASPFSLFSFRPTPPRFIRRARKSFARFLLLLLTLSRTLIFSLPKKKRKKHFFLLLSYFFSFLRIFLTNRRVD